MGDQRYVVTGASSDLGLFTLQNLLARGASVLALCNSRRDRVIERFGASFESGHLRIETIDLRLGNRFLECLQEFGRVDGFVGLAAMRTVVPYGGISADDLQQHFMTNVVPNVLAIQHLGPSMADRGFGRIVLAGSIGVKFGGGKNSFPYSLSKMALELIPAEARRWAASNVLYNVLRIGVVSNSASDSVSELERKAFIPMGRAARPEEIASFVSWLASDENSYITGQVIAISGGE